MNQQIINMDKSIMKLIKTMKAIGNEKSKPFHKKMYEKNVKISKMIFPPIFHLIDTTIGITEYLGKLQSIAQKSK